MLKEDGAEDGGEKKKKGGKHQTDRSPADRRRMQV